MGGVYRLFREEHYVTDFFNIQRTLRPVSLQFRYSFVGIRESCPRMAMWKNYGFSLPQEI